MTVTVQRFSTDHPPTAGNLNAALQALVGAINALAGDVVVQVSVAPGNDGSGYIPDTGGAFLGQISAPSILQGAHSVIDSGDLAGVGTLGVVEQAAAVVDLSQTISPSPSQAEVQAISDKLDELLAVMRAAGQLDT